MGTLGVERELGLGIQRLGFESGLCYLEVGDLGKSYYLSLIFPFYKIDMIIP